MNRRGMLRATGAALGGAGAAAVGLRWSAEPSAAETALELDIAGDHASLDTDDEVAEVWLDCTVEWAYELPDGSSPETVIVEIAAAREDDELAVVDSADEPQLFGEADGSEDFERDLLDADVLDAGGLESDDEIEVTVEARLRVEDGDDDVLARESTTDSATVSVDIEELDASEYGSVGGSGELRIETA